MVPERSRAREEIEKLVRFFQQNIHQIKSPTFNEAQTRQQLIDPFFDALGWDVHNKRMEPPYRLEVIPEGRVRTNITKSVGQTFLSVKGEEEKAILEYIADDEYKADQRLAAKKPDYRFRIGTATKFFVEAKKPLVDLIKNLDAIFQIKRYGFSARVPVSILTDFEEFRVFDCTRKPFYDKPKAGVVKEFDLTYNAYLDEFDRLYDMFSRDAVVAGSLEGLQKKYLEKRTGEFVLDRVFLDDLSRWRVELAQDVAKHPKNRRILNTSTLNECVQRILDRIVFLRVCEDRTIEETGTLLALLRLWQDHPGLSLYEQFNKLIATRRSLYNGLLFTEHECERLEVGNKVLEKVFKNINYPLSPYNFDEIGVEILGSIYERFLGKTIRLTKKQVRVEEKPEVRKAGGVYYTPQYIVNYIVENTVGKLLYEEPNVIAVPPEERETKQFDSKPTVTASGAKQSDLIGHSQIASPRQKTSGLAMTEGLVVRKDRRLKLAPKQISKLKIIDIACGSGSFLLGAFQKLIDYHVEWYTQHPEDIKEVNGELDAYTDNQGQLHLSARKKREILVNNIYGVDIDQQAVEVTQMSLYLKVLENENDATLNKPTMLALHEVLLPPLKNNIKCGNSLIGTDFYAQGELFNEEARRKVNAFAWEMEFPEIMQAGGFHVVIGNPPYVTLTLGKKQKSEEGNVLNYYKAHYPEAAEYKINTFAVFLSKTLLLLRDGGTLSLITPNTLYSNVYFKNLRRRVLDTCQILQLCDLRYKVFEDAEIGGNAVFVFQKGSKPEAKAKLLQAASRDSFDQSAQSVEVDQGQFYETPDFKFLFDLTVAKLLKKIRNGSMLLEKLAVFYQGIITGDNKKYLGTKKLNEKWRRILRGKDIDRYRLNWENQYVFFEKSLLWSNTNEKMFFVAEKLISRQTSDHLVAVYDDEKYLSLDSTHLIIPHSVNAKYLLGVFNSRLLNFYYQRLIPEVGKTFAQVKIVSLKKLPIRTIDFTNPAEKQMHDELVALVDKMLELHKQLHKASFDSEKEPIQRQIAATDKKTDELVYKLYGLTEEEIKIVEGSH